MITYTIILERDGVSMPLIRTRVSEELAKEFITTMRPGTKITVWCVEED